jgi:hypothetical protein
MLLTRQSRQNTGQLRLGRSPVLIEILLMRNPTTRLAIPTVLSAVAEERLSPDGRGAIALRRCRNA